LTVLLFLRALDSALRPLPQLQRVLDVDGATNHGFHFRLISGEGACSATIGDDFIVEVNGGTGAALEGPGEYLVQSIKFRLFLCVWLHLAARAQLPSCIEGSTKLPVVFVSQCCKSGTGLELFTSYDEIFTGA
jgi:hypothetical protein